MSDHLLVKLNLYIECFIHEKGSILYFAQSSIFILLIMLEVRILCMKKKPIPPAAGDD